MTPRKKVVAAAPPRPGLALAALVALAVFVRAAFAVVFLRAPVGAIVPLDAEPYEALAKAIASGRFDDPGFAYLNPPFAFLIAPFASLSAEGMRVATTALQIAMDAGVVALLFALGRRAFSTPVAVGAAALYAMYGPAVFYSAEMLPVTTSVLALCLALAALFFAHDRPPSAWILPGLGLGVFLLARPNGLALLPVIAFGMRRRSLRHWSALVLGLALVLVPFSVRSMRHGLGPSPFPVNGGINFYIGNSEHAHGRYAHIPNVTDKPGDQVRTSVEEASRRAGRTLDARSASSFWLREGLAWTRREPGAAFVLLLRKAGTFFRAEEPPLNISYDFARDHVGVLRACLGLEVVLPFALLGLGHALFSRAGRALPHVRLLLGVLAAYSASVIAFFVSDRYRMPAVPLLDLFAAYGVSRLVVAWRSPGRRGLVAGVAALALAAVFVNAPLPFFTYAPDGVDHVKLSDVYLGRGDYDQALAECEQARAISPEMPDTLFCFATAYYFKKDYFRAEMGLRATLDAQQGTFSDLPAQRNLAHVLKEQQRFEEALAEAADDAQRAQIRSEQETWRRGIPDRAAYARAQYDEAGAQRARGQMFDARASLHRAVQADPAFVEAWRALADVAAELRLAPETCAAAREVIARRPGDKPAQQLLEATCG